MVGNEWEEFFDGHAPAYMQNVFPRDSIREAEFVRELLALPVGARLLDIGCGTAGAWGRRPVELDESWRTSRRDGCGAILGEV